jgi:Protein of unknown function (DUF2817)
MSTGLLQPSFPATYSLARGRFLAQAEAAGADLLAYLHPLRGAEGEELALDVAVLRPAGARSALVIASATHGVEGFAGSGIQQHLLAQRAAWHSGLPVALVFVHAHNPHGFSFVRRTDERNVDLNRNGLDFSKPLPAAPGYDELHALLVPSDWEGPRHRAAKMRLQALALERGERQLAAAICGGQWSHPDGLFYGGREPGFACRAIERLCQQELGAFERVVLLDLHTGLGPRGHGELIYAGPESGPEFGRLQAWLGGELTSSERGDSVSAPVKGTIDQVYRRALTQGPGQPVREFAAVVLEFGTEPLAVVLEALIGDNWLHLHGQLDSPLGRELKARLKAALFSRDPQWQAALLSRSLDVSRRLALGLARQH